MIFLLKKWIKLSPLYHSFFFFFDEPLYHSYPKRGWVVKSFFYFYFLRKWLSNPYIAEWEETARICWPTSFTTFMLFSNLSSKPYLKRTSFPWGYSNYPRNFVTNSTPCVPSFGGGRKVRRGKSTGKAGTNWLKLRRWEVWDLET